MAIALRGMLAAAAWLVLAAASPTMAGMRIELWKGGVPGHHDRASIPEVSKDYWTNQINDPSITAFLPDKAKATGTSVLVVPGGGHRLIVITTEGNDVARWYADHGIAAFVLRYRLFREDATVWTLDDARADTERAMRTIRARAAEFGIDPHRIGVMGFSAGGELARMVALSPPVTPPGPGDAIDAVSEKPDWAILEFPGPLKAEEAVTPKSPPMLLSAASDDECCSQPPIDVMLAYRHAGASAELHLYAAGGHAFNMGEATDYVALKHWPDRIADWLVDRKLIPAPAP